MNFAEPSVDALERLRTSDLLLQKNMKELGKQFRILASMNGHGDYLRRKIKDAVARMVVQKNGSSR